MRRLSPLSDPRLSPTRTPTCASPYPKSGPSNQCEAGASSSTSCSSPPSWACALSTRPQGPFTGLKCRPLSLYSVRPRATTTAVPALSFQCARTAPTSWAATHACRDRRLLRRRGPPLVLSAPRLAGSWAAGSAMTAAAQAPRLLVLASAAPAAWAAARACCARFRRRWYPAHRAHPPHLRHRLAFAPILASEKEILKPSSQTVRVAMGTPTPALVSLARNRRQSCSRRRPSAPLGKRPTMPPMATTPVMDPILQTVVRAFVWHTRPHHMLRRFSRPSPPPRPCTCGARMHARRLQQRASTVARFSRKHLPAATEVASSR